MDNSEIDDLLRFQVRADVAGAAPPSVAWTRLQERIVREESRHLPTPSAPVLWAGPPIEHRGAWLLNLAWVGRISQVGVALMLLLLMIGDPQALSRLGAQGRTLAPIVAPVSDAVPDLRPPVRVVNRAALLESAESQQAEAAPPDDPVVADEEPMGIPAPVEMAPTHRMDDVDDTRAEPGRVNRRVFIR